jgi:TetR/AcrR family acrAB operon transcriptional repressor
VRRSKADAEQTRVLILDAAERVFCERGVGPATLEQVARAAGVTRGAFYWHFKDKADVLAALYERFKSPQLALIQAAACHGHMDPLQLLETTGTEFLALFEAEESRQRMHLILSCATAVSHAAAWREASSDGMFELLLRLMQRSQEAAFSLMVVMNGLMSEWLRSGKAFGLAGVGEKLLRRHMATLRRKPQRA